VSGKGTPAALFMVIAKTLLKTYTQYGDSPAAALERVNTFLCKDNPMCMFVTVFLGVIDLKTGDVLYANAGHNRPILSRDGEPYTFIKPVTGMPLGVLEDARYEDHQFKSRIGDRFYLYTDGITEAMNADGGRLGNTAFLEAANAARALPPAAFDAEIHAAVHQYSAGVEQSDDITTFAIYRKAAPPHFDAEITLNAEVNELERLLDWIEARLQERFCAAKAVKQILVVSEEIFVNIARYAYTDAPGDARIRIGSFGIGEERMIVLRFEDTGCPFNPLHHAPPDTSVPLEERPIGGLGIYFTLQWMDDTAYERVNGTNIMTVYKQA
jgi:sigma-B regulation protein RsbU (phosphoserine phosphatase)